MIKGTPQSKRNNQWQKRHEKRLLKDRARRKRGRGKSLTQVQITQVEAQFKKAQEKERGKKTPGIFARWSGRLQMFYNWFVRLVRRFTHWYYERQYKG